MACIEITETGRLDERESAFPQAVQLPNGDIVCSFSVGGGQFVHGGTDWARSTDCGRTWTVEGQLLAPTTNPTSANYLKLSLAPDGKTVYAYGIRYWGDISDKFGDREGEAIFCVSQDGCKSWSGPKSVPMPNCRLEVSHSICHLPTGRMLAPTALLTSEDKLGEKVIVAISEDGGRSWPTQSTVFSDPSGYLGFWEQKLALIGEDQVIAVAWAVSLGDYSDQENQFALSSDGGVTWGAHFSTGIRGQTMTPLHLGGDRLLVVFNQRHGRQGIVACLVSFSETSWDIHHQEFMYEPQSPPAENANADTGVEKLANFEFGFPTAIKLTDGSFLGTHWCVEDGVCGVRWTRFSIDW